MHPPVKACTRGTSLPPSGDMSVQRVFLLTGLQAEARGLPDTLLLNGKWSSPRLPWGVS